MFTAVTVIAGLVMLVGLVAIVLPVLPGLLIVWLGVLLWAMDTSSATGWWTLAGATGLIAIGVTLEYMIPGKRMRRAGVKTSTLLIAVVFAIVGAIVIPVIGLFLGFPAGIYLVERVRRGGHSEAWGATKHALRAVGLNILIELATGISVMVMWLIVVIWVL